MQVLNKKKWRLKTRSRRNIYDVSISLIYCARGRLIAAPKNLDKRNKITIKGELWDYSK